MNEKFGLMDPPVLMDPLTAGEKQGGMTDLVSTQKGGVTNLGDLADALRSAFPPASASSSPNPVGVNSLNTTAAVVISDSTVRHGIVFHNPGTTDVYVFPTSITTTPTVSAPGGAFLILPAADLAFPSSLYANVNCSWSAFSGTGTAQALTIVEFY
jgi:hypothetical protein